MKTKINISPSITTAKAFITDGGEDVVLEIDSGNDVSAQFVMTPTEARETAIRLNAAADAADEVYNSARTFMAVKRLLDSVWTLVYRLNDDGTVTILTYDRNNEDGYNIVSNLPLVHLIEDDARTVMQATITERGKNGKVKVYDVANPANVFSYK